MTAFNTIKPFTRYHALSDEDIRRTMMEDLMMSMEPATWWKTIDAIVMSWADECD